MVKKTKLTEERTKEIKNMEDDFYSDCLENYGVTIQEKLERPDEFILSVQLLVQNPLIKIDNENRDIKFLYKMPRYVTKNSGWEKRIYDLLRDKVLLRIREYMGKPIYFDCEDGIEPKFGVVSKWWVNDKEGYYEEDKKN